MEYTLKIKRGKSIEYCRLTANTTGKAIRLTRDFLRAGSGHGAAVSLTYYRRFNGERGYIDHAGQMTDKEVQWTDK
jgi:dihydrodipicolinate synthase/N-acetylneuraminate lyase